MEHKVTLREIVANKIIYAMLVVLYYWMWARRDWKDYYEMIQYAIIIFTCVFLFIQASRIRKFDKESIDEMAKANLERINHIRLRILVGAVIVIAFAGAMELMSHLIMGYALVSALLIISIIRAVMFYIVDVKGV